MSNPASHPETCAKHIYRLSELAKVVPNLWLVLCFTCKHAELQMDNGENDCSKWPTIILREGKAEQERLPL